MSDTPIQRYEVEEVCRGMDCYSVMRKNPDGDYVMHDDHETKLAAAKVRIAELEKRISAREALHLSSEQEVESLTRQLSEAQAQLAAEKVASLKQRAKHAIENTDHIAGKGPLFKAWQKIKELEAQLASAREDSARLDWLENQDTDIFTNHVPGWAVGYSNDYSPTLRSAIDEARGAASCNRCDETGVIPVGDLMNLHQAGNMEFGEAPCPDCAAPSPPASAEPGTATTWQAIETAPRDGTEILLLLKGGVTGKPIIVIGCFEAGLWGSKENQHAAYRPTFWHPLPPTQDGKEQGK